MNARPNRSLWIALALVVTSIALLYLPTLRLGFTSWDDPAYVTENPALRNLEHDGYAPLLRQVVQGNYHPVTMLTLAWDHGRAGKHSDALDPRPFHFTSFLLHLINTALVFALAYVLAERKWIAAAVCALFFGLHPMHVEPVAWISGRKELLYTAFFLACCLAYLGFRRTRGPWIYAASLALFALSLLSKPSAVVLPLVLILFDLYLDRRFRPASLLNKLPFFAAALTLGFYTLAAQTQTGAVFEGGMEPLQRIVLASYALTLYLSKLLVPIGLSAFHPYPTALTASHYATLAVSFGVIALILWSYRHQRSLFFATTFLLVNLVLVLQLVSVGSAIIAERYTYLAYVGPFLAVGLLVDHLVSRRPRSVTTATIVIVLVALLACAWITHHRISTWNDSITLWSSVIDVYPDTAGKAYASRGGAYREEGRERLALADYDRAIEIQPGYYKTYLRRANLYVEMATPSRNEDLFRRAVEDLDKAISLEAGDPDLYNSRALARYYLEDSARAFADYAAALDLDPGHTAALRNRARLHRENGDYDAAYGDYTTWVELEPRDPVVRLMRADTAWILGRPAEALEDFNRCIEANPRFSDCYLGRAQILERVGRAEAAKADRETAARLIP